MFILENNVHKCIDYVEPNRPTQNELLANEHNEGSASNVGLLKRYTSRTAINKHF